MEAPATYLSNLSPRLTDWLRTEGFQVHREDYPNLVLLTAAWLSPRGERFELTYTWQCGPSADAFCQFGVCAGPQACREILFTAQRVRQVKHAQRLLWGCVRFTNAWLLAHPGQALPF